MSNPQLKKQQVSDVEIRDEIHVFFNDVPVELTCNVEIEERSKSKNYIEPNYIKPMKFEIVGIPSGEVLYLTKEQVQDLISQGIVRYEEWIKHRDKEYKNLYFFRDDNYHKIRAAIDPTYKKPVKPNINEKEDYEIGDVVVCKGESDGVILDNRVGKIKDKFKRPKEAGYDYQISFYVNFSKKLMNGVDNKDLKNFLWVKLNNIKGLYKGDVNTQIELGKMQDYHEEKERLEDHEIDDDYHIKQLFKDNPGVNKVVLDRGEGNIKKYEK